ncbi:MAG: hypothetical protein KF866_05715 [Phycisphaeraceae bacterium]|nr:hypothetical protein [Phycisphaeraceae bacterium]MCW5754491.1 hypothetical protein [Phycisphaeraceae bacterium]
MADSIYIADLIQRQLREGRYTRRVRVLGDDMTSRVVGSDEVWYVPVSVHRDAEHMSMIYDGLSDVEENLIKEHGLRVILVPRIIPFHRWEDVA